MRTPAHILTVTAAGVMAGVLSAGVSANAALGSPHGPRSATRARAAVTDIREVVNQTPDQIALIKDNDLISVDPKSQKTGSMWVPWVGNDGEMGKSIALHRPLARVPYWIFQDYWNSSNQIRYSSSDSYSQSTPVPGSSTGGGRKRLIIRSDGSPFMENTS